MAEAGAERYLRKEGWLKLYRTAGPSPGQSANSRSPANSAFPRAARPRRRASAGAIFRRLSVMPCIGRASPASQSIGRDQAWRRASRRLAACCYRRARSIHRGNGHWRIDTVAGPLDANDIVMALAPPLTCSRRSASGSRSASSAAMRHFRPPAMPRSRVGARRRVGHCLAPMEQGIR